MPQRANILNKLREYLDQERFEHSLRVEKTAVKMARKHGVSVKKASLAALLHDCARKYSRQELLTQAKRFNLKIEAVSRFEPKLLHADLSALLAKRDFGITSAEILGAIKKHTTGTPGMTGLEKIIYLADHIEEERKFPGVDRIRRLAAKDLNRAIIESTSNMLKYLLDKGLPVHPGTVKTRNYYLLEA